MTFLPIVERELRIRARWRSTYWVRALFAVVAIAIAIVMMFVAMVGSPGIAGHVMLTILAWMAFAFCVVEGLRSTADCISEEKREGTLGLLFLTDLKGYDIVLGKFAATSVSSFYGLLAVVPVMSVPVLLGGVTGGEFWRVVLALFNAMFVSLSVGMLVSTLSKHERKAWTATVAVVGIMVVLMPIVAQVNRIEPAGWFSPTTALVNAFESVYTANAQGYWNAIGLTHLAGWLCLVVASLALPQAWQESGKAPRTFRALATKRTDGTDRSRSEQLLVNPIWWLTSRNQHQRRWIWAVVISALAGAVVAWTWSGADATVAWVLLGCALVLHFGISVWVASEASYSFANARSSGALELVLSTPMHVRQIVRGQQLAIKNLFFYPVLFLILGEFAIASGHIYVMANRGGDASVVFLIIFVVFCALWFVLDLFAVSRAGMWFGLTSQKPTHALTKTILFVLVLPLVLLPCCHIAGLGLIIAKSVILLTWAQSKLHNDFRRAATQRFEGTTQWWQQKDRPTLKLPS